MRYLVFILLVGVFIGCDNGSLRRLEQKYQALSEEKLRQDSLLNEFMLAFEHIEDNLRIIKEREKIIALKTDDPDFYLSGEDRILRDIKMISDLLLENKEIIEDLDSRWTQVNQQNSILRDVVSKLTFQLEENDKMISSMTESLSVKDEEVEKLNKRNEELMAAQANLLDEVEEERTRISRQEELLKKKEEEISHLRNRVNTAYFITGDKKSLKLQNVISSAKNLEPNFDVSRFVKINIDEVNLIPVEKKKVKLLTEHPAHSYIFHEKDNQIQNIEIIDPVEFWRLSKYLVVLTN